MDHRHALILILALSAGCVQKPDESATASGTAPEATKSQKPELGTWGFDTTAMDRASGRATISTATPTVPGWTARSFRMTGRK